MSDTTTTHREAYDGVLAALQDYFDAIYHGDTDLLRRVFMPQAHLFSVVEEPMVDWSLDAYVEVTAGRESPAARGAARADRILAVDVLGPGTAMARVQCTVPPKLFTDALTLVKHEGRWRIINKVFHYDPAEAARAAARNSKEAEAERKNKEAAA